MLFDDIAMENEWLARSNRILILVKESLSPVKSLF